MKQSKLAVTINGKKAEIYVENCEVYLMSHVAGWNKPNDKQPVKMHSWKSAAFLTIHPLNIDDITADLATAAAELTSYIENVILAPVVSFEAWTGPKFKKGEKPAPAPVEEQPAPAPVEEQPAPAPVEEQPAPAPVEEQPAPAPVIIPAPTAQPGSAVDALTGLSQYLAGDIYARVLRDIAPVLEAARPVVHEINVTSSRGRNKVDTKGGKLHKDFETVCRLVEMGLPVMLFGGTGTGKTTLCKQVAQALGLPFYKLGFASTKYDYTGYNDAGGRYVPTVLHSAVTGGGVCLLDEVDASSPDALLAINALRDGDSIEMGGQMYAPHKDFRLICTANTPGTGATAEYTGRQALDAAFLNGFAKVEINYDPEVELAAANGDKALAGFVSDFRQSVKSCGANCPISARNIQMIVLQKAAALGTDADILGRAILNGVERDTLQTIYAGLRSKSNIWADAMLQYINNAA